MQENDHRHQLNVSSKRYLRPPNSFLAQLQRLPTGSQVSHSVASYIRKIEVAVRASSGCFRAGKVSMQCTSWRLFCRHKLVLVVRTLVSSLGECSITNLMHMSETPYKKIKMNWSLFIYRRLYEAGSAVSLLIRAAPCG